MLLLKKRLHDNTTYAERTKYGLDEDKIVLDFVVHGHILREVGLYMSF